MRVERRNAAIVAGIARGMASACAEPEPPGARREAARAVDAALRAERATQRERVYKHEWTPGDLVMWDNRSTLHRGRRYDISERRELRRTTVNDTPEAMLKAA